MPTQHSCSTSRTAPQPRSRVITAIASGKGGVGKTWLAITLCHALTKHGRTALLFDGDLGMANVDIQLGLMPDQDLGGVIAGGLDLRSAITRLADSRTAAGGFDIIAGKSGSGALAQLGRSQIKALGSELRLLSGGYDHVILDLGAGLDAGVQSLADSAATTLVVVTDEPTSLTDAYAFIKVQAMRNPGADLRIVVNMAPGRRDGERTYTTLRRACEGFLKFTPPLAGIIRRDDNVRDAIRRQTPMLARHPLSPAAEDVEKIAETLTS